MCGIALPLGLLVPDGGQACADIRWYCKDAMVCTERWTTARPPGRAHMPAAPDDAFAGTEEAVPDRAPVERLGNMFEGAQSAVAPNRSQGRRGPRGTRPGAMCGAVRGELICDRRAMRMCGTPGSPRSIPPPQCLSRPG